MPRVSLAWILDKVLGKLVLPLRPPARYLVRLKRRHRIRSFENSDHRVLEIGGGRNPLSTHNMNVDAWDAPEVDIVHEFPEPMPFPADHVDQIISVAVLEHFTIQDIRRLLPDCYRVLKPGGVFVLAVPALDKIVERYMAEGCTDKVLRYLHGAQKDEHDVHLSVLDTDRWCKEIREAGFVDVESVPYDLPLHDVRYMGKVCARKPH